MPFETDERLKSYLDTNQLHREQMCLALLKNDRRFTNVTPRQPCGGADGGRDIEALYENRDKVLGAVGFINQANDSKNQKNRIKRKFAEDLTQALQVEASLRVFIFFTNIRFTFKEKDDLIMQAKKKGVLICEIWDREKLRIELDNVDGLCIRYQYLDISLSDAEQTSFFSRWGDGIQSMIATKFQKIEKKLDNIMFYQMANEALQNISIVIKLKKGYKSECIGHFRIFCFFDIAQPCSPIEDITLGATDKPYRVPSGYGNEIECAGIKYGMYNGAWERYHGEDNRFKSISTATSVCLDEIKEINLSYNRHSLFVRYPYNISMIDMNNSYFIFTVNKSIVKRIDSIVVYMNGYLVENIHSNSFVVDESKFEIKDMPVSFSKEEMNDAWVRIRPNDGTSLFKIDFYKKNPQKII